ncbi:MBL fold metallo-hydrolase [Micrococcus lylae]|uniref:MBL fold metallo-hydrolase n=1 Tax=Micrococcus lylae TaxID=1273 RepID=UPI003EBF1FC1
MNDAGEDAMTVQVDRWSNGPFEPVAERVLVARCQPCDVNVGLVVGDAAALLVDVGTHPEQGAALYRAAVRETEDAARHPVPVRWALLTHDHYDHWFGLAGVRAEAGERLIAAAHAWFGRRHGAEEDGENERVQRQLGLADVPMPDLRLESAQCTAEDPWTLDLGGVTVQVAWLGHAHAPSDLVARVEADGTAHPGRTGVPGAGGRAVEGAAGRRPVVFAGDLVEESGPPQAGGEADVPGWAAVVGKLVEFGGEDALYVPGHGAPVDAAFVRAQGEELAARAAG